MDDFRKEHQQNKLNDVKNWRAKALVAFALTYILMGKDLIWK